MNESHKHILFQGSPLSIKELIRN
uniref:Uncharacterized protein n=1 Tax=Anguilla anguilla TaxID=7936 RepID=A0A0E9U2R6_ANGAN